MKHVVSRELYAYWDGLRGARAAPERSDLDPTAIRSILADTVLLDVAQTYPFQRRDTVVRLSGTRLDALWGTALKGRSLVSLWRTDDWDAVRDLTDLVLDDQVPVVAGGRYAPKERSSIDVEILLLPLRHHGKTHARLLGSIVPKEPPCWLGTHALQELTLTSFRSITTVGAAPRYRGSPATSSLAFGAPVRRGRFTVHQGGR